MKSKPGRIEQQGPLAGQVHRLQLGGDRTGLAVEALVSQVNLFGLAIDQVGEGAIVGLVGGAMAQQVEEVGRPKKASRQMIEVHGYPNLWLG